LNREGAKEGGGRLLALAIGIGRVLVVLTCIAFFVWLYLNGGVPQFAPSAKSASPLEDCGQRIVAEGAVADRLAPALADDFMRANGYAIKGAAERIVGERNGRRCTLAIESSVDGAIALAERRAAMVVQSHPISAAEIAALRRAGGGDLAKDRAVMEHVIALDAIAVIVNAANRVEELSLDQARRIFLRQMMDWSEIGAARAPIRVYGLRSQADIEARFVEAVLDGDRRWTAAKRSARLHATESDLVEAVARDANGIGFVSAALLKNSPRVRPLALSLGGFAFAPTSANVRAELYPLPRRLFLYARADDARQNALVRAFIAYVKTERAFDVADGLGAVAPRSPTLTAPDDLHCQAGAPETFAYRAHVRGAERVPVMLRFLSDTSELDSLARDDIARQAPALREHVEAGAAITLVGHSDSEGSAQDNRALGLERALVVRQAFEALGVYGLKIESAGEACPMADNQTTHGQTLNRRVEIWVARAQNAQIAAGKS
jgi:phosphate transport system substrate-binding protein